MKCCLECFLPTGDKLLPQDEVEEEESPFPTLEEVEAMAAEPMYARRRKVTASYLIAPQHGNEQNIETCDGLDSLSASVVEPLYKLKDNGTLIGESSLAEVVVDY
jgi:hypothetical protein